MTHWQAVFSAGQLAEIELARVYVDQFNHPTAQAVAYQVIAKLAGLLDKLEAGAESEPEPAGIPYATEWGLPIIGDPALWYLAQGHHSKHTGHDWNLKTGGDTDLGEPVVSVSTGLVVYAAPGAGKWGNLVIVLYREPAGSITCWRYAHLRDVYVIAGEVVPIGENLGTVGKGGRDAYAAHLHLDARSGGLFFPSAWLRDKSYWFDPLAFLGQRGVNVDQIEKRY